MCFRHLGINQQVPGSSPGRRTSYNYWSERISIRVSHSLRRIHDFLFVIAHNAGYTNGCAPSPSFRQHTRPKEPE